MKKYPLKLKYIPRELPWGGNALRERYGFGRSGERIAEAWVLSVRDEAVSVIENGPLAGTTLGDFVKNDPSVLGRRGAGEKFPVLIKLIDAGEKLSVQVHPDDGYAAREENDSGKTEMWYVLRAEKDSRIVYGTREGVTFEELDEALRRGEDGKVLRYISPEAGDVLFIPPGLVHSIGGGITLAEIQENSDLTYRIYDYGRLFGGEARQLHTDRAAECVRYFTDEEIHRLRFSEGEGDGILCACDRFTVRRYVSRSPDGIKIEVGEDSFAALLVTDAGDGARLLTDGDGVPLSFGDTFFVPAGTGTVFAAGNAEILVTTV